MTQRPVVQQVLPVSDVGEPDPAKRNVQYIFEPSAVEVLAELLPRYVEMQVYNAILQNSASEQSARMVAMRNATDAARDMIDSADACPEQGTAGPDYRGAPGYRGRGCRNHGLMRYRDALNT